MEPVLGGDVALRDGEEAREARLARKQVVGAGIEPAGAWVVPDGQEPPLLVVEEAEVHRHGQRPGARRHRVKPLRARRVLVREGEARLADGNQVPGEVAGIHRGEVGRIEDTQVREVVPVHQVSAHLRHALHGGERAFQPLEHGIQRDEREVEGGDRGDQLEADVRGRSARGDDFGWSLLEIVWDEPVRLRRREALEVPPVRLRVPEHGLPLRRLEAKVHPLARLAELECHLGREHPREREHREDDGHLGVVVVGA